MRIKLEGRVESVLYVLLCVLIPVGLMVSREYSARRETVG